MTDPDRLIGLTRAWLGAIANNVIADTLKRAAPDLVEDDELEGRESVWGREEHGSDLDSEAANLLREELEKLSPLQKDVLAAAELYYKPGNSYQRLPNGVAKDLAGKHGTTTANIRKVRERTFAYLREKLSSLLEEH